MEKEQLRTLLDERGVKYEEKDIQDATQFRCTGGEIFSIYHTGSVVAGGKRTDLTANIEALVKSGGGPTHRHEAVITPTVRSIERPGAPRDTVFIVYGHDHPAKDQLELVLRQFGLTPIILQNLPASGATVIEKLEQYLGEHGNVGYACVLLTPDDEGHRAGAPEEKFSRARQNVVLELGMVLARLGRSKVAILHKRTVELPSDIAGLLYIPFNERVDEVKNRLFQELRAANYSPNPDAL